MSGPHTPWLPRMLARNAECEYLRGYGSPRTLEEFRAKVPVVSYDDLRISAEPDVLFAGRPVAFERTGGSTGAAKLIPYSAEGLGDFQRSMLPWLADVVKTFGITGRAYLSISPATRPPESIDGIPVGLSDGAYLGDVAASVLAEVSAVPFEVACITDVAQWREETIRHLAAARDLELISVWSPTFLLRLLDDIGDARIVWPNLKVVSCWTAGASRPFAEELALRVPHARIQPKGLLSTETVVTVPVSCPVAELPSCPANGTRQPGNPATWQLTPHGFFEFERDGHLDLAHELTPGAPYEVIATTASGLYRYRTGDLVRHDLEFIGRGTLVSDLVGEKLTEPFVAGCLQSVPGFRMLVPDGDGYVLMADSGARVSVDDVERRLCDNPQYAYARRIGQLEPLRLMRVERLLDRYTQAQMDQGVRLGDVKPPSLRNERAWIARLGGQA